MHRKRLLSRVFVLFCFLIKLIYCLIDTCFLVQMTRGHLWKSWDIFVQGNGYRYYALSVAKRMFSHVLYEGVQTNKVKKKALFNRYNVDKICDKDISYNGTKKSNDKEEDEHFFLLFLFFCFLMHCVVSITCTWI